MKTKTRPAMLPQTLFWACSGIALSAALLGSQLAQSDDVPPTAASSAPPPSESTAAPDSSASAEGSGEKPAAPPVAVKPRPAEIMPRAAHSLMLGLVDTGEHLVAVGDRGQILVSNDGKAWAQVDVPVRAPLTAVTFVDAKNGWAVGHDASIVHTSDGGKTWALQNFQPELEKPFLGVAFLDAQHGFAVGAYGLFDETTDGGTTWNEVTSDPVRGDELNLYSVTKLNNGDLFIAGEQGRLAVSSDAGKTWKRLDQVYEGTLFGSVAVGPSGVLMCGLRGHAFLASDARKPKWQTLDTGTKASFYGCATTGDNEVSLFGLNGAVLKVDTQSGKVTPVPNSLDAALSAGVQTKSGLVVAGEKGLLPAVELK